MKLIRCLRTVFVTSSFLSVTLPAMADSSSSLTVLAFGDPGTGKTAQYEVASTMTERCRNESCDMAIMLGDNIYEVGVESSVDGQWVNKYEVPYSPLNLKIYPTLGNHDAFGNTQAQVDYSNISSSWVLPAKYHDFTKGPVHFFVINSNNFNQKQRKWLEQGLRKSKSKWKIVYGHHPIRSYGSHGHDGHLVRNLEPLLCEHADMYISGHDHDLQYLRSDCGLELVVSGAAGKVRPSGTGRHSLFGVGNTYGFTVLKFDQEKIVTTFYDKFNERLFSQTYDGTKVIPDTDQIPLPPKLTFSKAIYAVNESIIVKYERMQGNKLDWIGLARTGEPDEAYLDLQYTDGKKSGTFTFKGLNAGQYQARAYFNDTYGIEIEVKFTVK